MPSSFLIVSSHVEFSRLGKATSAYICCLEAPNLPTLLLQYIYIFFKIACLPHDWLCHCLPLGSFLFRQNTVWTWFHLPTIKVRVFFLKNSHQSGRKTPTHDEQECMTEPRSCVSVVCVCNNSYPQRVNNLAFIVYAWHDIRKITGHFIRYTCTS